jgi:hypothetical protein
MRLAVDSKVIIYCRVQSTIQLSGHWHEAEVSVACSLKELAVP